MTNGATIGFDEEARPFGIPYGSFPRLVLAHIITRVVHTHERRIELNSHFSSFLRSSLRTFVITQSLKIRDKIGLLASKADLI